MSALPPSSQAGVSGSIAAFQTSQAALVSVESLVQATLSLDFSAISTAVTEVILILSTKYLPNILKLNIFKQNISLYPGLHHWVPGWGLLLPGGAGNECCLGQRSPTEPGSSHIEDRHPTVSVQQVQGSVHLVSVRNLWEDDRGLHQHSLYSYDSQRRLHKFSQINHGNDLYQGSYLYSYDY